MEKWSIKWKMNNLEGYVVPFSLENDAVDIIIDENPEIC